MPGSKSAIQLRIDGIHWNEVTQQINETGYALVNNLLTKQECSELIRLYNEPARFRKTINMERYRFGRGEYKYLGYPLPVFIQMLRESLYPPLASIANHWMQLLKKEQSFPGDFPAMQSLCRQKGQDKPTVLILKYEQDGYNTLHQDLYGELFFPIQAVLFLNDAGRDYTGGEFVLTEQVPRAQSRATVLQPGIGDLLLFTTHSRPAKSKTGYYRVNMKHGVSKVQQGQRYALGIIFHDAQ